ncbi:MAG: hypothetical protein OEX77_00105 [Candidatus Bathyarchaeota archaeon]|nr:hypothetical protein [Candidatus Bathyarchaeota archaeon]MDH5732214.1 hypothetical protein [Candidatus Bathyarchaeota archaeon]
MGNGKMSLNRLKIQKVLRLVGMNGGFEQSSGLQQQVVHGGVSSGNYHNNWKEIEAASLEAEYNKAKALMELQKRFIC